MHIKQIIIQGFKSFKDQTIVQPFDKRHNVVVGRNGSGKSNFFYAIQFVLSDEFTHLGPESRQQLLHEGTGDRVTNAYIEIIFDNTDNRVPIDKHEIFLRRAIGAKKDQFFLNKKLVSRSEVVNLLESTGFSKCNPYYVVKQGKITEMATATDSHRLKLLREVAGTRLYDERKEKSMNILLTAEGKMEKITEFLQTIEDQLKTLEGEKEELKEYQKWDKARRILEFMIHETELKEMRKALDKLACERKSSDKQNHFYLEVQRAQEKIIGLKSSLKDVKKEVAGAMDDKSLLMNEQQSLMGQKSKLDLAIDDLTGEVQGGKESKERAEINLEHKKRDPYKEKELNEVRPKYDAMKRKEEECARELLLKEQKRKELYAKQARHLKFSSRGDRDKWIQNELKLLSKQIDDKTAHKNQLMEDLKVDAAKQHELEGEMEKLTAELKVIRGQIDEHIQEYQELTNKKYSHRLARDELWLREAQMTNELSRDKEERAKADQALRSIAGRYHLDAIDSVRKVLELLSERGGPNAEIAEGYYGPVIENFRCLREYYTAVEVIAGNRLFYHIVESNFVGTKILKEMNRLKLPGDVTFMPLNQLQVNVHNYPDDLDSFSMISKLEYEDKYDKAFQYIFGRTLICRNLNRASELAKCMGLDCVTLEGDQISSEGCLSGGYFNKSQSCLDIQNRRIEYMNLIKDLEDGLIALRNELQTIEGSINNVVSEIQKNETQQGKLKDARDRAQVDIRLMKEGLERIERFRNPKERLVSQCKSNLDVMNSTKECLESELHEELMSELSLQDQQEVDQLKDDIRRLNQETKEAFSALMELEVKKTTLKNLLTNNLFRRREEIVQCLQEIPVEDRMSRLQVCRANLVHAEIRISKVTHDLQVVDKKVKDATKAQESLQKNLEISSQALKEAKAKFEEDSKKSEKYAAEENSLRQKIDECTEKIVGLGALPQMDPCYTEMSMRNLLNELEKAKTNLKNYNHVNKKAIDQFLSVSKQYEKLCKRREELYIGNQKLRELIETLDMRKVEAIQFTFTQVSNNFTTIFKKLVPKGSGYLVMNTKDNYNTEFEAEVTSSDDFVGIGIRVSFISEAEAEMREMNQLSGGQKSLVSLALIFAIQKCDPAPFYLFDEIDQALDTSHRKAVAELIHELSENAQFITTTFRPELLEHAHKFYGVRFHNKVSYVDCVTKEVASDFVDQQAYG